MAVSMAVLPLKVQIFRDTTKRCWLNYNKIRQSFHLLGKNWECGAKYKYVKHKSIKTQETTL